LTGAPAARLSVAAATIGKDLALAIVSVAMRTWLLGQTPLVTGALKQIINLGFEVGLQEFAGPRKTECIEVMLNLRCVELAKTGYFRVC